MIRLVNRETIELVHPFTGKIILTIACDTRWERLDIQKDLESALAHCCEMYFKEASQPGIARQFIVASILRRTEHAKTYAGVNVGVGTDFNLVTNVEHGDLLGVITNDAEADLFERTAAQTERSQSPKPAGSNLDDSPIGEEHTGRPDPGSTSG